MHVMKMSFTGSSGLTEFPAFEAIAELDDIQAAYCNAKVVEAKQDWMQELFTDYPDQYQWVKVRCLVSPYLIRYNIDVIMNHFNQSEGTVCSLPCCLSEIVDVNILYFYAS